MSAQHDSSSRYAALRRALVTTRVMDRGVSDPRVLRALMAVPRHEFVPPEYRELAYVDRPLPLGQGQTISQPSIVGLMTELALSGRPRRALDVGTGSGYQAAVLAELGCEVYSLEIRRALAQAAQARLALLGYGERVRVRCDDGAHGWPEHAPFDLIVVAAAPERVPEALVEQLAPGGRLVLPVGRHRQDLVLVLREASGRLRQRLVEPVRFVPLVGPDAAGSSPDAR